MWIGRFKLWHRESIGIQASAGLDARVLGYYLNVFNEGKETFIARVAVFEGPEREELKKRFLADPRMRILHQDGDQLFYAMKASDISHTLGLDRNVFFVKPVIVKDGFTHWTLASWDKKHLTGVFERLKKTAGVKVELLSLRQGSMNVFLPGALAKLTPLQKEALKTTIEDGYYEYPRIMSLEDIAKKHKLARTTLQSHLRKAEGKIIKAVMEQERF